MRASPSAGPTASLPVALGLTALGLFVGYLIKSQCATNPWADNFQFTHFCYNEIQALFGSRGISRGLIPYVDTRFEYPVLTGIFMDLAGRLLRVLVRLGVLDSNSDAGYLAVSSGLLAPFAFIVTMLLRPRVPASRLGLWAVGSPSILYIFHNWDLLAVCGAVWGLVSLERGRIRTGGAALAVGASAKLFPVFFLPGAFLHRLAEGDRRGARNVALAFLGAYGAINLPWILISGREPRFANISGVDLRLPGTNGWLEVWLFHADRYPDYWTVWYWIAKYGRIVNPSTWWDVGFTGFRDFVSLASFALFGLGSLWLLWSGWKRRVRLKRRGPNDRGPNDRAEPQSYPVVAVSLGVVALFLLTSKVYSPQYALWVVPMLAMLDIPWKLVFSYLIAEFAVLASGFYWFTVIEEPSPAWMGALEASVWLRALTLVLLVRYSLRANRLYPSDFPEPHAQPAMGAS